MDDAIKVSGQEVAAEAATGAVGAPFDRYGGTVPGSPIVLSVPHAGRDYPPVLREAARVPHPALATLEDREMDALALAARTDEAMLVQRRARAWIDLNRGEDERDPRVDEGAFAKRQGRESAKVRSGLGLVPRRGAGSAELWRRRFTAAEVERRIAADHRPYHAALGALLAAARARFGIAVLIDLHSMPSIPGGPVLVIGDRFGRSAGARFVARIEGEAAAAGLRSALNTPYAGGHILDRHGAPAAGVHAIQIEFDRGLYLDERREAPGRGLPATAAALRAMLAAVRDEAIGSPLPLAAE